MSSKPEKELTPTEALEVRSKRSLIQLTGVMSEIITISGGSKNNIATKLSRTILKFEKKLGRDETCSFEDNLASLFRTLYMEHRKEFLSICEDSNFVLTKKLRLWFGEDVPAIKAQRWILPFSNCYESALKLRNEAKAKIQDEVDDPVFQTPEYTLLPTFLYYLLDTIINSLSFQSYCGDLPSLLESLEDLRDVADVDDYNEVPGSSIISLARKFGELATGKKMEIDEKQLNEALVQIDNMTSNPEILNMFEKIKEENGQEDQTSEPKSMKEMLMRTIDKVEPMMKNFMPMSGEPMPEGVKVDGKENPDAKKLREEDIEKV